MAIIIFVQSGVLRALLATEIAREIARCFSFDLDNDIRHLKKRLHDISTIVNRFTLPSLSQTCRLAGFRLTIAKLINGQKSCLQAS